MTFAVPSELESFVAAQVARGLYARPEELFVDALRKLREETEFMDSLRQADSEVDRGEWVDGEAVFADLRRRAAEIERKAE